jgi:flagellar biosynthesis protein FlhF
MLVKKFEAEDMATALKLVKDCLGGEALILSTRTLRKKGLGMLGRQTIEVTAAIESPAMKTSAGRMAAAETKPAAAKRIPAAYRSAPDDEDQQLAALVRQSSGSRRVEVADNPLEAEVRSLRATLEAQDVGQLKVEIDQLKSLMQQLAAAPAVPPWADGRPVAASAGDQPAAPRRQVAGAISRPVVNGELAELSALLTECGIDAEAAATIARFAGQQMTERQRQDPQQRQAFLTRLVADLVQTSGPLWQPGQGQQRVALIGPTGVGKTTTIAKLAADAITSSGARVALVTIDTYRIAAVEQLKVYGEIMGLPVEVVFSPDQLQEAFRRHRDKDLILIDTAGRSPRDSVRIEELNQFLGRDAAVENCLVLAAPTEERQQRQILKAFSQLPIARLIFTKLDETDRCGALINLPTRFNLPLAYLTNGQQVPEDLLLAEPVMVAELVMANDPDSRRMAV